MSIISNMLRRLTDNYNRGTAGNVAHLLNISASELEEIKEALETTALWRSIDEAEGLTLDRIGRNVDEPRGNKDDDLYRQYIKIKIISNLSAGRIETLYEVASVVVSPGEVVSIEEGWQWASDPLDWEPAAMLITVEAEGEELHPLPFIPMDRVTAGGVQLHWDLQYLRHVALESEYEAQFSTESVSNIALESEYEAIEMFRDTRICGTFAAGEEVVL